MIVDDHEFACRMIREVLRAIGGSNMRSFTNGEDAWGEYKLRPADIVFLDWEMAPVNGLELTRRIRNSKDSPNVFVPIIMITGYGEVGRILTARDAGGTEYVIKPIAPKALFDRVVNVIERPRQFVRAGKFFGPDRRRRAVTFNGPDRRGGPAPDTAVERPKSFLDKKRQMRQEEVNDLFNPDGAADRLAETETPPAGD